MQQHHLVSCPCCEGVASFQKEAFFCIDIMTIIMIMIIYV